MLTLCQCKFNVKEMLNEGFTCCMIKILRLVCLDIVVVDLNRVKAKKLKA